MPRITPRTCLWPLAGSISLTFALSIGLTFRSDRHCYAGTCGEWLFPLQARLHVAIWYCWLGISVTILALRAFQPWLRKGLQKQFFERKIPLVGKQLGLGGLLVLLWVISLYGVIVGVWWARLDAYFTQRGIEGGVLSGNKRLAAIALTGHLCDITMGMAILPISRHSALASFFKISVSTTLTFHMVTAYTLFALVMIHGFLYISWIPIFEALPGSLRSVYPVLNPTYLYRECWPGNHSALGIWRASLVFTGTTTAFIMLLIFITTLPVVRFRHFNVFYFTHLLGIVAIIVICLHASTMFYCTAPGQAMWALDWAMRLYELWVPLNGKIEHIGKGWYCVHVPLPRRRLRGCASSSPLAHFYIYQSDCSIRELHPFTTTTHLASQNAVTDPSRDDIDIQFLFRERGAAATTLQQQTKPGIIPTMIRRIWQQNSTTQWTCKFAGFAQEHGSITRSSTATNGNVNTASSHSKCFPISVRLEGPYFTPADPYRYRTVICVVAGTGISGALAIAGAFKEHERRAITSPTEESSSTEFSAESVTQLHSQINRRSPITSANSTSVWTRCIVIWSVREENYINLPELRSTPTSGLDVRLNLTGVGKSRLSFDDTLDRLLSEDAIHLPVSGTPSTWVYVSGPNAFIAAGEAACKKKQGRGIDWYGARWDI